MPDTTHNVVYCFSRLHCDGTPYSSVDGYTNNASLNKQDEENRQIRERGKKEMYKTKNIRLLSELPDPFSKSDLVKLRRKYGMEGECAYIITRWLKAGFVDYEGKQYKKIANPNDKTKNS